MADEQNDSLQEKQDDLLEQLGLHPAQLAIQRRLLNAAHGDSSGLAHQEDTTAAPAIAMPSPPAAASGATPKALPRPEMGSDHSGTLEDALFSGTSSGSGAKPAALPRHSMFSNAEDNISKHHHFWGGVLKGLDIAGSMLAPGAMSMVPGSMLNQKVRDASYNNTLRTQADIRQRNALATQEEAKADSLRHPLPRPPKVNFDQGIPVSITRGPDEWAIGDPNMPQELKTLGDAAVEAHKQRLREAQDVQENKPDTAQQDKQHRRELEGKLKDGTISEDERAELVTRQQEERLQGVTAEALAQAGRPPVPAQYPKGENDKQYKKDAAAWGKVIEGIKAREASAPAEARGAAYGAWKPVQVLDPTTNQLQWTYARDAINSGAAPAAEGTRAMAKKAQFDEMHVAADKAESAIQNLDKPFDATQIAKLTLAMSHDEPTLMHEELKALLGTQQLTEKQKDFVVWIGQLNERALSLRSVAGMGQGSQDLRQAIRATLPSAASGDKDLALRQLAAFKNQVELLERGVPGVKRTGDKKDNRGNTPPPVNKNPNSDIGFTPSQN
jgi:hypothetical protein